MATSKTKHRKHKTDADTVSKQPFELETVQRRFKDKDGKSIKIGLVRQLQKEVGGKGRVKLYAKIESLGYIRQPYKRTKKNKDKQGDGDATN